MVAALSVFYGTAFAQSNIDKVVKELDQKNANAVSHADTAALMQLLAPEFTINRTTGTITSGRAETMQLMRHGMVAYDSFAIKTEMVIVQGPTLAVSMGSEVVVSGGNRELKGQVIRRRFTHVWVKEDDSWKLFARHANNVCEK